LVELRVGTGAGGLSQRITYWESKPEYEEQANPPQPVMLANWLTGFTTRGRKLVDNYQQGILSTYNYKGIETDGEWGPVHVFEGETRLTASDLYYGKPLVERRTFDTDQLRQIEISWTVRTEGGDVLHRFGRLKRWLLLEPGDAEIPANAFDKITVGTP
jgi:hypothetical protein